MHLCSALRRNNYQPAIAAAVYAYVQKDTRSLCFILIGGDLVSAAIQFPRSEVAQTPI